MLEQLCGMTGEKLLLVTTEAMARFQGEDKSIDEDLFVLRPLITKYMKI